MSERNEVVEPLRAADAADGADADDRGVAGTEGVISLGSAPRTDRERFVRRICLEPNCDTARLVFADWLDEHGERARARYIRRSVLGLPYAEGPGPAPVWNDAVARLVGCRTHAEAHRAGWSWQWRRGFVETLTGTFAGLIAHAPAIFAGCPVTRFVPQPEIRRHPGRRSPSRPEPLDFETGWGWAIPLPADRDRPFRTGSVPYDIPADVFECLPEPGPDTPGGVGWPSREEALGALAAACVRYGRRRAGLPLTGTGIEGADGEQLLPVWSRDNW
jgi:uncharacterized protein (TIGR02996 family)